MFGNARARSQQTTIGASTAETTIVTADPATRNQLVGLHITTLNNAIATLTVRDATGGTTRLVYDYPNAASVPTTPLIVAFDPPLDATAINSAWTIQASVNGTGYKINAIYVKEQ